MAGSTDEKTAFQVERLAFFSDAVFAIAITLLALNVHPAVLPPGDVSESDLLGALQRMVPSVIGFVVSFLVIGIYWRAHHRLFRWVRGYNEKLISLNLHLLLCVSFVPCPTAFYSLYPSHRVPLVFYCLSLSLAGLVNYRLWRYVAGQPELLDPATPRVDFVVAKHRSLLIPCVFGLAAALSMVNLLAANVVMMGTPVLIPLYTRILRRRHHPAV